MTDIDDLMLINNKGSHPHEDAESAPGHTQGVRLIDQSNPRALG